MINTIRDVAQRYPSLVVAAVVLSIGFLFTVYKMSTAFEERNATPEYQNRPASIFAQPPATTIVDPLYVTGRKSGEGSRLPDEDYQYLLITSRQLSKDLIFKGPQLASIFQKLGMPAKDAAARASEVRNSVALFNGQEAFFPPGSEELDLGEEGSAEIAIPVTFSPTERNESAASERVIRLSYRLDRGKYLLDDVRPL